jgi:hypothetical protein
MRTSSSRAARRRPGGVTPADGPPNAPDPPAVQAFGRPSPTQAAPPNAGAAIARNHLTTVRIGRIRVGIRAEAAA